MKLIDADKLMKDIIGICKCQPSLEGRQKETVYIKDVIENQPTAFDVDKVIEELEKLADELEEKVLTEKNFPLISKAIGVRDAIDIVRKGGIDE